MSGTDPVFIGALALPRVVLHAVLDIEARGITLTPAGDAITATPAGALSADEKNTLRRWRWHVLTLLAVCADREGD